MNETYWLEQIRCGESSRLQFKCGKINGNSLAAEFAAFANSKGGTLLFGVEDKTGVIVGLTYEEIQELSKYVGNVATQLCNPTIYLQTETLTLDDKRILAIHIEEGSDKPYKDKDGTIWVKQGADKRKVTENSEILRLFSESKKYYPDEDFVSGTTLDDLDDKKIDQYLKKIYKKERNDFGMSFSNLMRNMHIATDDGKLTLGGLLYFGKDPQQFHPNFCIKAVSFFGNKLGGNEYRDSRDITGTIPEMFDEAMRFLNSNLHHVQAGQSFNSVGILEISRIALEEIVQNALCHRDYIRQAAIRILIFDNRVEIVSPGALPDGLSIDEIMLGNSIQRNPLICTFCAKTMIYRGLGSGIIRALQETNEIEFVNQGNQFTTIFKRKDTFSDILPVSNDLVRRIDLSKLQEFVIYKMKSNPYINGKKATKKTIDKILRTVEIIYNNKEIKTSDIAKQLSISDSPVRAFINKLKAFEIIKMNGSNKNRTYSINDIIENDTK